MAIFHFHHDSSLFVVHQNFPLGHFDPKTPEVPMINMELGYFAHLSGRKEMYCFICKIPKMKEQKNNIFSYTQSYSNMITFAIRIFYYFIYNLLKYKSWINRNLILYKNDIIGGICLLKSFMVMIVFWQF